MRAPHEDTLQSVLNDAHDVQWAALQGAYGASDATDHYRDVPRMLLALATLDDMDSATWGDAYDDFFLAQLWHQFTIYPVTPVATGLLIRIASLRSLTALDPATQINSGSSVGLTEFETKARSIRPSPRLPRLSMASFSTEACFTWRLPTFFTSLKTSPS